MNCVFCSVVEKNEPHHEIVWSDKRHIAFLNIKPAQPGHVLVIPRKHVDDGFDLSSEEFGALMEASRRLAVPLKAVLNPSRVALALEGFHVPHAHVHLIPVNKSGDMMNETKEPVPSEELVPIAEALRAAIASTL
ncbi:MAG: HIT family protein [bacterium]